jgi:glycosyltransferase involved in cell wall biosynthesis
MTGYSAIVTTMSGDGLVVDAVSSIISQSLKPDEIIVVVNGSEVCDQLKTLLSECSHQLVILGKNFGANYARNIGAERAGFPILAFMDDDDLWTEEKMSHCMDSLASCGSTAGVMHAFFSGQSIKTKSKVISLNKESLSNRNDMGGFSSAVISRKHFFDVGGLDERLKSCQDWDLWLRFQEAGYSFSIIQTPLSLHRVRYFHGISQNSESSYKGLRTFYFKHQKLLDREVLLSLVRARILNSRSLITVLKYFKLLGFKQAIRGLIIALR